MPFDHSQPPLTNIETTLFLLSGEDRATLLGAIDRLLSQPGSESLSPNKTANPVANHGERLAIVAPRAELPARLALARQRLQKLQRPRLVIRKQGIYFGSHMAAGRLAFIFPGQGSQYPGMLRELHEKLIAVQTWFAALDDAYRRAGQRPPTQLIYPPAEPDQQERQKLNQALLDMEQGAQLGTVANLALHEILTQLGIQADVMVGHSNGEHAAIIAAGMLPITERQQLSAEFCRLGLAGSRLPEPSFPEGMITVSGVKYEQTAAFVTQHPGDLFLAMDNCPHQQVVAGRRSAIKAVTAEIIAAGGVCAQLPFTRAYHTPLFADWAHTLESWYRQLPLQSARLPVYSCLTNSPMPADPAAVCHLMIQQWTSSVRFRETIETVYEKGVRTFIEVGPDSKLTAFVEDILRGRPHLAVSASSTRRGDLEQLQHMLAALHAHGLMIDPQRFQRLVTGETPTMPTADIGHVSPSISSKGAFIGAPAPAWRTALAVHRQLIARAQSGQVKIAAQVQKLTHNGRLPLPQSESTSPSWPFLGSKVWIGNKKLVAERSFTYLDDPFVLDHSLGRRQASDPQRRFPLPVLAFTTSLEIITEAARRLVGRPVTHLSNLRAHRWLALDGGELTMRIEAERHNLAVQIRLVESSGIPGRAFAGTAHFAAVPLAAADLCALELDAQPPTHWTAKRFYKQYAFHGPSFQGLSRVLAVGSHSIEAELTVTEFPALDSGMLQLDPALLDCAGQLVAFWLLEVGKRSPTFGIFPFAARRVTLYGNFPPSGSMVRCRSHIEQRVGGITEANFVFMLPDGRVIAAINGFAQRLIAFPRPLAHRIFSGKATDLSRPVQISPTLVVRRIDVGEWTLLTESWGIWARALAHLALTTEELAIWLKLPHDVDGRCRWLLTRLVAKEAVRSWALQQGLPPPNVAEIGIDGEQNIHCLELAAWQPSLKLAHEGNHIIARVISYKMTSEGE